MPFNVECLHMYVVITFLGKIFTTNSALVGHLPRVDTDMVVKVIFSEECLATKHALMLLLTGVLTHMQLQVIFMNEGLTTLIAGEGPDILMAANMCIQVLLPVEAALTHLAFVRAIPYSHVHPFVGLQITLDSKAPVADVALEGLDASVGAEVQD